MDQILPTAPPRLSDSVTFHSLSEMIFEIPLDHVIFGWPAKGVFHFAHLFLFLSLWHLVLETCKYFERDILGM